VDTTLDPRLQGLAARAIAGWLHLPIDRAAALVRLWSVQSPSVALR
jgi:hypothetical protein